MKKVIAILLITVMAFGAAACQKTPESPIVVGNNTEKMIEQAQKIGASIRISKKSFDEWLDQQNI